MYARLLPTPWSSTFLFGPRGTGKSTWLRDRFPQAATYDLLDTGEALRLAKEPHTLYRELSALPAGAWAVIDEVQKVPALLDEVHRLIETRRLRFVLSGSSARKLRRRGVNLLAGRAVTVAMMPLVSAELAFEVEPAKLLRYGSLPMAVAEEDPRPYLRSYAETYLMQEVQAEALTRDVGAFARFLEVAARHNAQTTNASGIAKAVGIGRETVRSHFEILVDTLLGYWLPAWKLKSANKQVAHSKFYFFDTGVVRALSGRLPYPPSSEEEGPLAETFLLNELRAYLAYSALDYRLHFWRTHDGAEVDVLCETANGFVAIEIKAAMRWDNRFNRGLRRLREHLPSTTCYGVYFGERTALWDDVYVLPVLVFLKRLWDGDVIRYRAETGMSTGNFEIEAVRSATMSIEEILAYLNEACVRCTYRAVGDVIDVRAQSVGKHLGEPRKEASWVVNARTGQPTGYTDAEKHPRLEEDGHIIRSGDELLERMHEHKGVRETPIPRGSSMPLFLGYDPGGKDKHGVVAVEITADGTIELLETKVLRDAEKVCSWVRKHQEDAVALGIDTLLAWSRKGRRACDDALRQHYRKESKGGVIAQNSLYSAMTINGVLVAQFARDLGLPLFESHPKLVFHACLKNRTVDTDSADLVAAYRDLLKKPEDHEADALVAAWCASRAYFKKWPVDLYEDIKDELIFPAGPAVYPWPEPIHG